MSIILSLIIEIGCLEPRSIISAGLVKSIFSELLIDCFLRDFFNSSNLLLATDLSLLIAFPKSFFLDTSTFLNSEKYLFICPFFPKNSILNFSISPLS